MCSYVSEDMYGIVQQQQSIVLCVHLRNGKYVFLAE